MLRNNKLTDQYHTQQHRATLSTVGASKDESLGLGIIAGIGAGAAFVFVSIILLIVYLCYNRKNNHTNNSHDSRDTKNTTLSQNGTTEGIGGAIILTSNSTHNNNSSAPLSNGNGGNGGGGGGLTPKEKKTFMKLEDDINRRCTKRSGKTTNFFLPSKKKQQSDPSGTNGTNSTNNNGFLRVWDNTNPTTSTSTNNKGTGKSQTQPQQATKSKGKSIVQKDERQPSNSMRDQRNRYHSTSSKRTGIDDNDSLWGPGTADDATMYTERDENGVPRGKYGQKQGKQQQQHQQRTISRNSNPSFGFSSSRLMMISNENNDNDSLISGLDTNGNYQSSNRSMMTYAYSLEAGNIDDNTTQHDAAIGGGTLTSDGEYHYDDSNASFGAFSNVNHHDMIEVSQDDGSSISISGNEDFLTDAGDTDDGMSSYDTRQLPQDDDYDNNNNNNNNNHNDNTLSSLPTNMIRRSIVVPAGKLGIVIDTTNKGPVVFDVNPNSVLLNKIFPGDVFIGLNNINTRTMSAIAITELVLKTNNQPRTLTVLSNVK